MEPKNGEAMFNLGSVYLLQSDFKKTLEYYNRAEENGFKKTILYTNFAAIYKEMGDTAMELRNYTKAIESNPLRGDLYVKKIVLYLENERYNEALVTLDEMRKIIPDAFEGYDLASKIYMGMGDKKKALSVIEEGRKRFPNDINLMNSEVTLYIDCNEYEKAQELLDTMKKYDNTYEVQRAILMNEISIASSKGDSSEILEKLEQLIAIEPEGTCDEQTRYMNMMLLIAEKEYNKALDMAESLAGLEGDSEFKIAGVYYKADMLKKLGRTSESEEQFKHASRYFRKLSVQKNTYYEIYIYRGMCYTALRQYDKAMEMADYIESLQPDRADAHLIRAEIYDAQNDVDRRTEQLKMAQQKDPRYVMEAV
jgi:tetratricopeptide (TPR) repeat protein